MNTDLQNYLRDLLVELLRVDTSPRADLAALAAAEARTFDRIEAELARLAWPGLVCKRLPINPAIGRHPFYSNAYYATPSAGGQAPPPEVVYAGRSNLIAYLPGAPDGQGRRLALNVHVDTVCPYFPPRIEGDIVHGRGACDDKGPLAALLAALRLVADRNRAGQPPAGDLTLMFVIDEETGGNGSLSLAIDRGLRQRYDALMVLECCGNAIHPGNRGAVWYKVAGHAPGLNLFEAAAFVVGELEAAGRAIKAESAHPLFPHRPVQTCHGILGGYGQHPSRICARVETLLRFPGGVPAAAEPLLRDVLAAGLAEYTALYGDKTTVADPATGQPKVARHFDLEPAGDAWRLTVHGATGHMGSILENDGAITKWATLVRALLRSRAVLARAAGAPLELAPGDGAHPAELLLEGGQGFLPTHPMPEVMDRLRAAVQNGFSHWVAATGRPPLPACPLQVTFDKLHNAAFAGAADSAIMRAAIRAARATGLWTDDRPVRGWDVSCDARLFATEYPELPVLTAGPGQLRYAHADNEQLSLPEAAAFAEFLAEFMYVCWEPPFEERRFPNPPSNLFVP